MAVISAFRLNGNWNDSVGSNWLTVSGATSETYGWFNGSYSFADGNYMNKDSASWFPAWGTADLTYCFRAKWDTGGLSSNTNDWVWTLANSSNLYAMGIVTENVTNTNILSIAQNDGGFSRSALGSVNIDGRWHNYVAYRGSSGTQVRLYEDWKRIIDSTVTGRSVVVDRITVNWNSGSPPVNSVDKTHSLDEIILMDSVPSDAHIMNMSAFYRWFF